MILRMSRALADLLQVSEVSSVVKVTELNLKFGYIEVADSNIPRVSNWLFDQLSTPALYEPASNALDRLVKWNEYDQRSRVVAR